MTSIALAVVAGALFGAGLVAGGMTDPSHVLGFLDPLHGWLPQLAFVMAGALATYAVLFRVIRAHRATPLFDAQFHVPVRRDIDLSLLGGAALFGTGWGLAGLCPGPALVGAGAAQPSTLLFVVAMVIGMVLGRRAT